MKEDLVGSRIIVLQGGPGAEREVSLASGKSVSEALCQLGAEIFPIDVHENALPDLPEADAVFNVIHGTFGEDGQVQAILEDRGMPYTGAGVESSRLAFDKAASKKNFIASGVPTPRSVLVDLSSEELPALELPFVAKPLREGSSVGVHIVRDREQWQEAREDLVAYGDQALVEVFIEGSELTVGILDDEALPVVHIEPVSGFYDMKNKYPWLSPGGKTLYHVPADLPATVSREVQEVALQAHQALGVEVYSRVDVLLDADQRPFVLEINTIPGMTQSSLLPKAAAAAGIDFPVLCHRILQLSLVERTLPHPSDYAN